MSAEKQSWGSRVVDLLGLRNLGFVGKWVGISVLIGFAGGLTAAGFRWLLIALRVNGLQHFTATQGEGLAGSGDKGLWALVFLPVAGFVVGWITWRFAPEAEGHGTEQMVRTFHLLGGKVRRRVIAIKAFTSALTIGSGGSAGQEGPVAQVGSGVGSAIADFLHLTERDRRIFLLAGSSAGIGALFTAPLGGALFAPEVLYKKPEFEGEAIIPCIISSIVAYETLITVAGNHKAIVIPDTILRTLNLHDPRELLIYFVLAICCTVISWIYVRTFEGTHDLFLKFPTPTWMRPGFGGLLLALLALGLPHIPNVGNHGVLFGGYELMESSIAGQIAVGAMIVLIFAKILATSFAVATGGSGGVFAPSLSIGGLIGATIGQASAHLFPSMHINPACYALVGMGSFFAGAAKVPIASIIIVSEMTGSYGLLGPLMFASVIHMLLATRWTIYDTQVPGLVDSPAHFGDFVVDVLARMRVADLMDEARPPQTISQNTTLRQALDLVANSTGYYYPVVDAQGELVGIFSLSDVRRIFQEMAVADFVIVRDFMVENVVTTRPDDDVSSALQKMNEHGLHEIPVVDAENPRNVLAMLTRHNLGAAYNRRLHALKRVGA